MNKSPLPKNWIVVTSKTHPDRVYYFNVKTQNSSWEKPSSEKSDRKTSGEKTKKRKKCEEDQELIVSRPTTPEYDSPEKTSSPRKKLAARRSHKRVEEKADQEKETPQMRAIREKLLKKKQKIVATKTNSSKSSEDSVTSKALPKATRKSKSMTLVTEKDTNLEACTPQMKVLYEKMQQRLSKGASPKSRKSDNNNKILEIDNESKDKQDEPIKLRRPRSASIRSSVSDSPRVTRHSVSRSVATSDNSSQQFEESSQKDEEALIETHRKRLKGDTVDKSIPLKRARKSTYKKNLGKERMDKLRKSLNATIDNIEYQNSVDSSPHCSSDTFSMLSSTSDKGEPPTVYKNAQVRLVRLKDKLSKGRVSFDKRLFRTELEEFEQSSAESETTVNDLVKKAVDNSFCEEMDWEPLEDEEITCEVQAVRTQLYTKKNVNIKSNVPANTLTKPMLEEQQEKKELFIVVDTNVFLSNIEAVELARDTNFKTYNQPIIVIPWTVIRELDYIKDNKSRERSATLMYKARKAVQYLNKLFASKHPRVIGQTPEDVEMNKRKFAADCPDDEILQTCLQIRDLEKSVVLLSYDKNLCNKAMIHDIVTLGRNDPFEKVDYLNASNNRSGLLSSFIEDDNRQDFQSMPILNHELHLSNEIFDNIKIVMKDFLTVILSKDFQDLFGNNWERHVIYRPPWTVVTVLQCAVKHWIAVTSESFLRKGEILFKDLLQAFHNVPDGGLRLKEVGAILEKCNDIIQMVKVDKYPDLMLRASRTVDELKKRLHEYETAISERKLQDAIGIEDNILEQERRAEKAFQYFEAAYTYARDMSGLAAEAVGMPCGIAYEIPSHRPSLDELKQIQPELAANVNRLLHTLTAVLEEVDNSCIDHRTLLNLYQTLITCTPQTMAFNSNLTPLDIYCCVKKKEEVLKAGLRQLQELSTHLCRLAQYRCR